MAVQHRIRRVAMPKVRAAQFPQGARADMLEWDIYPTKDRSVNIEITVPGQGVVRFSLLAEEAYELHADIGAAYDKATAGTVLWPKLYGPDAEE